MCAKRHCHRSFRLKARQLAEVVLIPSTGFPSRCLIAAPPRRLPHLLRCPRCALHGERRKLRTVLRGCFVRGGWMDGCVWVLAPAAPPC